MHRLSPYTKLLIALSFTLTSFLANNVYMLMLLVCTSMSLLLLAKGARHVVTFAAKYLIPMLAIVFIVQSFWYSGGSSPIWSIGPIRVKAYGFLFASTISLRLLIVLCGFYLMMYTTHPTDLFSDLERRGLPRKLAYVLLATLQSMNTMKERVYTIIDVQQCRGVEMHGSLIERIKAYFPLIAPLIVGSVLNIESQALALELRGFSADVRRTYLYVSTEMRWEGGVQIALYTLPIIAILGRIAW
jgi:energy-coupling factor transport system permease protein